MIRSTLQGLSKTFGRPTVTFAQKTASRLTSTPTMIIRRATPLTNRFASSLHRFPTSLKPLNNASRPFTLSTTSRQFTTTLKSKLNHPSALLRRTFTSSSTTNGQKLSLGQRMRQLSKEYGWSAAVVYILLTVLDFPFCFLTVRLVGKDKIAEYEHAVIDWFWRTMPESAREWREQRRLQRQAIGGEGPVEEEVDEVSRNGNGNGNGNGVKKDVSIWTELALAYALHKSLIIFRVPLTAAITPRLVKMLRSYGWNIGQKGGIREGVQMTSGQIQRRREIREAIKKQKKSSKKND